MLYLCCRYAKLSCLVLCRIQIVVRMEVQLRMTNPKGKKKELIGGGK